MQTTLGITVRRICFGSLNLFMLNTLANPLMSNGGGGKITPRSLSPAYLWNR